MNCYSILRSIFSNIMQSVIHLYLQTGVLNEVSISLIAVSNKSSLVYWPWG